MANNGTPFLCGGTFLFQILRAKPSRLLGEDRLKGQKDKLPESEVFKKLISIYQLSDFYAGQGSTLKKNTTNYKSCKDSVVSYINANDKSLHKKFDKDVKSTDSKALQMMCEFTNVCIRENWADTLVKAILDMIEQDAEIPSDVDFYISGNGVPTKKKDLLSQDSFYLAPFLLGVWHYIVMNRMSDNENGKDTYESWFSGASKNKEYVGTVGDDFKRDIKVEFNFPLNENTPPTAQVSDNTDINSFLQPVPQPTEVHQLHPNTHYNLIVSRKIDPEKGEPFEMVNDENLLNDKRKTHEAIVDAIYSPDELYVPEELINQIKMLPTLFGPADIAHIPDPLPYYIDETTGDVIIDVKLPEKTGESGESEEWTFGFGFIEELKIMKRFFDDETGEVYLYAYIRPRIERIIPAKALWNSSTKLQIPGLDTLYKANWCIRKADLIAELNNLGVLQNNETSSVD